MKKILLLLVIAFLPVLGFGKVDLVMLSGISAPPSGPLCGTYYVGTGGDFTTITQAVNYLNANGVSCAVTFLLTNELYENVNANANGEVFPLTINNNINTTATNTVTFKPAPNKNVKIKVNNVTVNYNLIHPLCLFKLDGADYIVFDGSNTAASLNVVNNGNTDYNSKSVFWLTNVANNITIKNLKLTQVNYNADDKFSMGIFSGDNNTVGNAGAFSSSGLVVSNNVFEGVKQGLYVNNSNGATLTDVTVNNNKFGEAVGSGKVQHGVYLNGTTNFNVFQNEIKDVNVTFTGGEKFSGIYVNGNNGVIDRNNIFNVIRQSAHLVAGVWLNSNVNINTNVNVLVSNNFIANVKAAGANNNQNGSGYGLYMESGNGYKIYHNTINLIESETAASGSISSVVLINSANNIDLRNNILVNNADAVSNKNSVRRFAFASFNTTAVNTLFSHLNYNNYYVTAGTKGFIFGNGSLTTGTVNPTDHYNLAEWLVYRATNNIDQQSENIKPIFFNDQTDLRLKANEIINVEHLQGVTGLLPTIVVDYFGSNRYLLTPTMGAHEIPETGCATPINDNSFGINQWNGYVYTYTGNNTDFNTATYIGTVKENQIPIDRNFGDGTNGKVTGDSMNIPCVTAPYDRFMVRYKRKITFAPGNYNITVGGDDGYRISFDGGATWEIQDWTGHSYGTISKLVSLSGEKDVVLEYYEQEGIAHVSFSYGIIQGDPTVFGNNVWNVYGFNYFDNTDYNNANDTGKILLPANAYSGYYVQSTLGVDTRDLANNGWDENQSPSSSAGWQGAPISNDNFTITHKRKGFPCGRYQIQMEKWDDKAQLYINEVAVPVWYTNGYSNGSFVLPLTYNLNKDSKIELRLKEGGGGAGVKMTLINLLSTYSTTGWTNGEPNKDAGLQINNTYTVGTDLTVCSCTVKAGQILTIDSKRTLTVLEDITVEAGGQIIVSDEGALVQVDDLAIYNGEATSFTAKRNAQPMYRYDFTYWSSPVEGFKLKDVSPTTLFDKFYSWNATTQAWSPLPQLTNAATPTIMQAGTGYIVRAPQTYSTNPTVRETLKPNFIGKPNNGVKNVQVANGAAAKWNLIGNPYPSAIDLEIFMDENDEVLEGAVYLWTHNSAITNPNGGQVYTYSDSDYVTVNSSGKVESGPIGTDTAVDNFKIASGQSFFVRGKENNPTGTQVVFTNAMRVREGGQNGDFFRPGPTEPVENWETKGKHRVWLNLTGGTTSFNQAMVGYIENATNAIDSRYDADVFSGGAVSLYSVLETKKFTIQGRALPFNNQDEVPLGYKTTLLGTLKIAIDHFDGLFEGQDIYLEDKVLNIVHNLKEGDYTFTTVPGTFNERFVLRYVPAAELGTDNPTVDANSIMVFRNGNQIDIKSNDQTIENVTVYDLLGKVIFDKNKINAQSFSTSQLTASNQMVIVKVITDTQAELVKKVLMN